MSTPATSSVTTRSTTALAVWINDRYLEHGFTKTGFIGWKKFIAQLVTDRPSQETKIKELVARLRVPGSSHELPDPFVITNLRSAERIKALKQAQQTHQVGQPAAPAKLAVIQVSTPPVTLQRSMDTSVPSNPSRLDVSIQPQHVERVQNLPTSTSNVRSTSRNGIELVEQIVDSSQHSTQVNPLRSQAPLEATALAASNRSFDFASPLMPRGHFGLADPDAVVHMTESEWESDSEIEEEEYYSTTNSQSSSQARTLESNLPLARNSPPLFTQPSPLQPTQISPPPRPESDQRASEISSRSSSTCNDPDEVEMTMDQAITASMSGTTATHHVFAQEVDPVRSKIAVKASEPEVPVQSATTTNSGFAFKLASPVQIESVMEEMCRISKTIQQQASGPSESVQSSQTDVEANNVEDMVISNDPTIKGNSTKDLLSLSVSNNTVGLGETHIESSVINMENLVWTTYRKRHCDASGVPVVPMDFQSFSKELNAAHPRSEKELNAALKKFDMDSCVEILKQQSRSENGYMRNRSGARNHLQTLRTDLNIDAAKEAVLTVQRRDRVVAIARMAQAVAPKQSPKSSTQPGVTATAHSTAPITIVRSTNNTKSATSSSATRPSSSLASTTVPELSDTNTLQPYDVTESHNDTLAKKLKQLQISSDDMLAQTEAGDEAAIQRRGPDLLLYGKLLTDRNKHATTSPSSSAIERSIRQAPLLAAHVVAEHYKDFVPQYGLLGSLEDGEDDLLNSQLFLNTNVPFSAFVCGVQGSGKSHTTSCVLENAVLKSPNLGHLESPASTLVFSYGEWSGTGAGFNISEATFLGAACPGYPGQHVKRVTVLYSPSNPAIKQLYKRLPNVTLVPFKLKARTLDISALRTLMAVDEKSTTPLYMARVETILRGIASESKDGCFDYAEFKNQLAQESFDPTQTNMLEMRLGLLESFLDLTGECPEPEYRPGELTIIDLSDAFVTPSTACILFKLGLERFLQSPAPAKMLVLDEAHKYMLDTPGSKVLTNYLTAVIRLQRHQGARIVVSTQEPTIATELIALCSVIIMHRFTSPAWYAALRRHINAVDDDKAIMQQIESLETGEALVYSPNAVLGKKEDGSLTKSTGRLMKVNIRNRITLDGGASIMAV
ncbi:uncharacterized protein EKO05_0010070 [Ascochyta rabiei]|nr:uncharacterized protein EKO05_0010070 [Ascochyta rabiei]UPX19819.1 hypothetical protein EKO05_0010070 [Ascochyta rabiei]